MKAFNRGGNAAAVGNLYKTVFVYGVDGKLIAEYGPTGQLIKEYVYFNNELLSVIDYKPTDTTLIQNADMDGDGAIGQEDYLIWTHNLFNTGSLDADVNGDNVIDSSDDDAVSACASRDNCVSSSYQRIIYYVYNDSLGTPKVMTDAAGVRVWTAKHDPFGKATVNEDVDGNGVDVSLNLRFPGQYYDGESGLHYNYYRYYDPATGRYITSDPIGLAGGLNTFAYVEGNPLNFVDSEGLVRQSRNQQSTQRGNTLGSGPYGGYWGNIYNHPVLRNDALRSPFNPKEDKTGPPDLRDELEKQKRWEEQLNDIPKPVGSCRAEEYR